MKVTSETLRKIAAMPEQAMVVALSFLAEQLEADEHKRTVNLTRQKRYVQRQTSVSLASNERQNDGDLTLSRVEDNNNLSSSKENLELTLSLSKPLPKNPRALGTNPRAIAQEPADFAAFMAVYPRRSGSVDRKQALKAWEPAKKRADVETIMDGARRYNSEMTAKGKIGSEFVKQARTWLNGDGWTEYQASSMPLTSVPKMAKVVEGSPAFEAWCRHNGKRPMVTEARVDGVICRVAYFPTEYPPTKQEAAA